MTAQTAHFLFQTDMGLSHEALVAAVPQFIGMARKPGHMIAGRFDGMFPQ
jgi:hypothetical protein